MIRLVRAMAAIVTAAALTLALTACRPHPPGSTTDAAPRRIVSMSPSVTETLFALDLGDRVVGVTRYCEYPPAARALPKIGGYIDPSFEAIVALEPDLVILHRAHQDAERRLQGLGLHTLRVDQDHVAGILTAIDQIADACGVAARGRQLRQDIERRLHQVSRRPSASDPRVLIVANRTVGNGRITVVWASGRGTFHDDILGMAGGANVLAESAAAYPELSREGLLSLDPDVILDLVPDLEQRHLSAAAASADWADLHQLRAVRDHRVHVLDAGALVVPGPRIVDAVALVAAVLHPDE